MGRDREEKLARKARGRNREARMNQKSHLIFTLYTIYGILLKGESGTSGAYMRVFCAYCVCVLVHVTGQQQGRMEGQQHARSQSHHTRVLAETCGPPSLPHRVSHSPACVFVRARVCTCVECTCMCKRASQGTARGERESWSSNILDPLCVNVPE